MAPLAPTKLFTAVIRSASGWPLRQKRNQLQPTENCVESENLRAAADGHYFIASYFSCCVDSSQQVLVVLVGASDEYTLAGGLSSDALVTAQPPTIHSFLPPKKMNKCLS